MDNMIPKIIKNAEMAKLVWDQFTEGNDDNERIKKYFHLRPTNSGVTIVTTLSGYEMRGITNLDREGLTNVLYVIADCYPVLVSLNDDKKNGKMRELGFAKRHRRSENRESSLEEFIQATVINTMSGDSDLAKILNVQKMQFIASELIFKKGPYRVDIVGFDSDSKDLYFFELKKERTLKKIGQLSDYIRYYNEPQTKDILKKLLKTYPINPIKHFQSIRGVMVMKYAENSNDSRYRWRDEEKKHGVDILFYSHSLSYKKS